MVVELEANQAQVQRIIHSKAFRTSEVHRNLLQYLAEKSLSGTADSLKEYTVGLDVFAKPVSYDPRQESVVRMHVARLRQKLAEYYRTEGVDDPVIVDVPKGGFKVTFEQREIAPAVPPVAAAIVTQPPESKARNIRWFAAVAALALVCVSALGVEVWRSRTLRTDQFTLAPELEQLWSPIFASDRPLMICLATPNGPAGPGIAGGAFLLGQFLSHQKENVLLTRTDQLAMPEVLMDNVIFLGPVSGNRQIEALSKGQPLVLEPNGIRNLNPQPGEPAFIADQPSGSRDTEETYALISHVPGLYGKGDILYLSGNQIASTVAAVRALTDPVVARTLVSNLKSRGGTIPRYFQVVLRVQAMDSMPIAISYILHRDLTPRLTSATGKNE